MKRRLLTYGGICIRRRELGEINPTSAGAQWVDYEVVSAIN